MRPKKLGANRIELVGQFNCLWCGFSSGLRDWLIPGLCSHLQARTPRDESQTGQDVDAPYTAHRTLLNTMF